MSAAYLEKRVATRLRIDARAVASLVVVAASCTQFCLLASISFAEVTRRSLSWDFAVYYQAFYLIAHGHPRAFESLSGLPFVELHANFLMWPLGAIGALSSSPLTLKLISDAAAALATCVALGWVREILERNKLPAQTAAFILVTCALVAVLNPWTYQSNAFDFHFYAIAALASVGIGRALYNGQGDPACGWLLLGISAGDVATTVVSATAFGAALALPYARRAGFELAASGGAVFALITFTHLTAGNQFGTNFAYLKGAPAHGGAFGVLLGLLEHPALIGAKIAAHADALYANLSPAGFVGLVCPFTALPVALVLFENLMTTNVHDFIWPGNESAPVYYLMLPGLGWMLAKIARTRLKPALSAACLLVVANCGGWFYVWFPLVEPQWLRVAPATSAALDALHEKLGEDDEVIASDYFVGSFADRRLAYGFRGGTAFPIRARTYVAISTRDGTGRNGWPQAYGGIAMLLQRPGARLVSNSRDLWVFEIPQATDQAFDPPASAASLPAAVFASDVGRRDLGNDTVESDGRAGYLVRDATWRDPPGHYAARIGASGPVVVEAWDVSRGVLLARKAFDASGLALMPFELKYDRSNVYFSGRWIFRCGRQVAGDGNDWIELRVAVPGGGLTRVDSVTLDGDHGLEPTF